MPILPTLHGPADLRGLTQAQLEQLAAEIRETIIATVATTGGHLGSSLGVVEMTIALHRLLESPRDRIVWDTGHQAYPHKLLTGRFERFGTLRSVGGVGGFPRRSESEHDVFDGGHAGTGLSIGQGLATARDLRHGLERIAVVVGDAAITSGLSLEALNDIGQRKTQLLIVLNDNEMSISPTVGGLSKYLSQIKLSGTWQSSKTAYDELVGRIPVIGPTVRELSQRLRASVVNFVQPGQLFEDLGITYIGLVPGHDIRALLSTFSQALELKGPVIVHVRTQKGHGFTPAETDQVGFHGAALPPMAVPPSNNGNGAAEPAAIAPASRAMPTESMADDAAPPTAVPTPNKHAELHGSLRGRADRACPDRPPDRRDHRRACRPGPVCRSSRRPTRSGSSTSGSPSSIRWRWQPAWRWAGCGPSLRSTRRSFNERSTRRFTTCARTTSRSCSRSIARGWSGRTGRATRACSRSPPSGSFRISSSRRRRTSRNCGRSSGRRSPRTTRSPSTIRATRGSAWQRSNRRSCRSGAARSCGKGVTCSSSGSARSSPAPSKQPMRSAFDGWSIGVINARFAKPLDRDLILDQARGKKLVVTFEESVETGGFGSGILEAIEEARLTDDALRDVRVRIIGIPGGRFVDHGSVSDLRRMLRLDAAGLAAQVRETLASLGVAAPGAPPIRPVAAG